MRTKMLRFSGILFMLLPMWTIAQREGSQPQMTIPEYITKYSEIAKAEMRRSGIPASITLAQGILESTYGNSKLAMKANNHFGIKCGANWNGPTFIQDDDTEKECFRKYESVLHSYADHSNFLRGKDRYASLFELNPKDYKGWAHGLQKAGYATNPNYATLLIRLIEERELHRFDTEEKYQPMTAAEEEYFKTVDDKYYVFNGIKTVIAQPNETAMDIAIKYDVSLNTLLRYNDLREGDHIMPGSKIYLGPKKSNGAEAFHRVMEGETMHFISQKEGIKLKTLYKKNRMTWGQEPAVGEILCLQKKCNSAPKVKSDEEIKADIKEKIQNRVDEAVKEEQKKAAPAVKETKTEAEPASIPVKTAEPVKQEPLPAAKAESVQEKAETKAPVAEKPESASAEVNEEPEKVEPKEPAKKEQETKAPVATETADDMKQAKYHTVGPKETLYRVASKYGLTVDALKKMNGLASNNISIGQRLIVGAAAPETMKQPEKSEPESPAAVEKPVATPQAKPATAAHEETASAAQDVVQEKKPKYHVVAPQETMYKIASQYNISVAELKVMNDLTTNELNIGQKLLVGYTGVTRTDPRETPQKAEAPEEKPKESTPSQPTYHKVAQGETLYSIAQKYNLNVEQLKTLNNLPGNDIQPGRVLKLR